MLCDLQGRVAAFWRHRGVVAPSRHRRASSAGEEVVGGLFFDFEAVWTVGGLFFDFEAVWTDVFACDLEHISTSLLVLSTWTFAQV